MDIVVKNAKKDCSEKPMQSERAACVNSIIEDSKAKAEERVSKSEDAGFLADLKKALDAAIPTTIEEVDKEHAAPKPHHETHDEAEAKEKAAEAEA